MSTIEDPQEWGALVRSRRAHLGWSLADLAEKTQLSRAYISAIERGRSKRPGADVVRRLEMALGPLRDDKAAADMPPTLAAVVAEHGLTAAEASSLAGLRIRGQQPQTKQRWDFIYKALLASETLDLPSGVYDRSKKSKEE